MVLVVVWCQRDFDILAKRENSLRNVCEMVFFMGNRVPKATPTAPTARFCIAQVRTRVGSTLRDVCAHVRAIGVSTGSLSSVQPRDDLLTCPAALGRGGRRFGEGLTKKFCGAAAVVYLHPPLSRGGSPLWHLAGLNTEGALICTLLCVANFII